MSVPGENAQSRATMTPADRIEWQSELDSAMSDLDFKLSHPRRRASDIAPQPTLPQLGQIDITSELLDELAWRLSEQLRRNRAAGVSALPDPAELLNSPFPSEHEEAAPQKSAAADVPDGIAMVIRVRRPLFSWRFWRRRSRRRDSMVGLSEYRL